MPKKPYAIVDSITTTQAETFARSFFRRVNETTSMDEAIVDAAVMKWPDDDVCCPGLLASTNDLECPHQEAYMQALSKIADGVGTLLTQAAAYAFREMATQVLGLDGEGRTEQQERIRAFFMNPREWVPLAEVNELVGRGPEKSGPAAWNLEHVSWRECADGSIEGRHSTIIWQVFDELGMLAIEDALGDDFDTYLPPERHTVPTILRIEGWILDHAEEAGAKEGRSADQQILEILKDEALQDGASPRYALFDVITDDEAPTFWRKESRVPEGVVRLHPDAVRKLVRVTPGTDADDSLVPVYVSELAWPPQPSSRIAGLTMALAGAADQGAAQAAQALGRVAATKAKKQRSQSKKRSA